MGTDECRGRNQPTECLTGCRGCMLQEYFQEYFKSICLMARGYTFLVPWALYKTPLLYYHNFKLKKKKKITRTRDLRINMPTDWATCIYPSCLPILSIYLCSWVPVRSHSTYTCWVARDHTQVYDTTWEATVEGSPWEDAILCTLESQNCLNRHETFMVQC